MTRSASGHESAVCPSVERTRDRAKDETQFSMLSLVSLSCLFTTQYLLYQTIMVFSCWRHSGASNNRVEYPFKSFALRACLYCMCFYCSAMSSKNSASPTSPSSEGEFGRGHESENWDTEREDRERTDHPDMPPTPPLRSHSPQQEQQPISAQHQDSDMDTLGSAQQVRSWTSSQLTPSPVLQLDMRTIHTLHTYINELMPKKGHNNKTKTKYCNIFCIGFKT